MRTEIKQINELFKHTDRKAIKLKNPILVKKGTKFVWKSSSGSSTEHSARDMIIGSLVRRGEYICIGNKHNKAIGCGGWGTVITACSTELLKQICEQLDISSKSEAWYEIRFV